METQQQKIVITANGKITTSGTVLNNKIYFGSDDNNVYEYNPVTGEQKIVIKGGDTSMTFYSSGTVLNNKIYFGSQDGKVYEYNPVTKKKTKNSYYYIMIKHFLYNFK